MFACGDSDEEFADQQRAEGLGSRLEAGDIEAKVFSAQKQDGLTGFIQQIGNERFPCPLRSI
jgi:hypothetical protein